MRRDVMRLAAGRVFAVAALAGLCSAIPAAGAVGDPQVKTDHPWYPGELAFSTFERMFRTQAALYERVTGRKADTDEDKALASWFFRNICYAHGEDGKGDYFDTGFAKSDWNREYWFGLFAHGFGLCGTTHAQWTAEMNSLLGHCRARTVGVSGHNSFEVWLTGGPYGEGRWALLDHDISTVIFDPDGKRLLSIQEIVPQAKLLGSPRYRPERQRGWRVSGLHDADAAGVYTSFRVAEYLSGYAGPPPMVHLRRGESLRRYLEPGLDDGKTFVFWGRNYRTKGIPGPERSHTWVNQPQNMYGSTKGAGYIPGQARYANAVYVYKPDFAGGAYREGVIDESPNHVTFEFHTPYVIAATPPNDSPWGIYDKGCRNGLVITGNASCPVSVSTDRGRTWQDGGTLVAGTPLDLTDLVKGHQQYWIRFAAGAASLANADLSWKTVCQCNCAVIPRLKDGTNRITFSASGLAVVSAGPNKDQAEAHLVEGAMGSKSITLELKTPRGEKAVRVYAASWNASGVPPAPAKYSIEWSADGGKTFQPVVKDWEIVRRAPEPGDFWSQSFCYGDAALPDVTGPVRVRFSNTGGRTYRKVEAHLAYRVAAPSPVTVTFAWKEGDAAQLKTASRTYTPAGDAEDASWELAVGQNVRTAWVEYAAR